MSIIAIIPARMGSSRFPGKPLEKISGVPMVGHVYAHARKNRYLDEVYIATCDKEIADYAKSIHAPCIMTANHHQRCTERCSEALEKIEQKHKAQMDIVVILQGDEPMVTSEMIDMALVPMLKDTNIKVVNLMSDLTEEEYRDPNEIKVVVNLKREALYFSRAPIPTLGKDANPSLYKQVCVIPFRRNYLLEFNKWRPTPLEVAESIDMLRVLEHGGKVQMVYCPTRTYAVDTPQDLLKVQEMIKERPTF